MPTGFAGSKNFQSRRRGHRHAARVCLSSLGGYLLVAYSAAFSSCNGAGFQTKSDTKTPPEQDSVVCNSNHQYDAANLQLPVKGDKTAQLVVSGEFCPEAPAQLRIVFLVDFSLSMYNKPENRGNDPVVNDRCGRLDAVKALVDRHVATLVGTKADAKVGVITFADDATTPIPLTDINSFAGLATPDNLCQGLTGTNYRAAFDATRNMLKNEPGTKVVYLISDGLPTEGGGGVRENAQRHRDAAQSAVDELHQDVANVTLSTVMLGDISSTSGEGFDPQQFLAKLTGSADRVKFAANAAELAQQALSLQRPPVNLDTSTAKAVLKSPDGSEQPVVLQSFEPAKNQEQVWTFTTAAFQAFPDGSSPGELVLSANDTSGEAYQISMPVSEVSQVSEATPTPSPTSGPTP